MAKTGGLGDALYIGGYDLSGDVNSLSNIHGGPAALDVTAINKSANERIGGLRDGSLDMAVWMNPAAGQEHAALSPLPLADVIATYCRGTAVGNPAASCTGKQISYDWTRGSDASLSGSVSVQADGDGLEWGEQLTPGAYNPSNSMTGDASTFEGGISNWVQAGNCTIAQTAAQAHSGTKSLGLTSSASGNMSAASCAAASILTQGTACAPGQAVYVQGWFRTAVSARTCNIGCGFYDASGVVIGGSVLGSSITDSNSAWTLATASLIAPAATAWVRVFAQVASAGAASEVHYIDDIVLRVGPGSQNDGASTSFGAQAYLQVFSFTGTDVTVKIQDSADNVTFADVTGLTFTQITSAPGTQRLATAGNATIRQYLQAVVVSTAGFTALSYAVQLTRNLVAVAF